MRGDRPGVFPGRPTVGAHLGDQVRRPSPAVYAGSVLRARSRRPRQCAAGGAGGRCQRPPACTGRRDAATRAGGDQAARQRHADPGLGPGNSKTETARLCTYMRDVRSSGGKAPAGVWFANSPDRKGLHPQTHRVSAMACCRQTTMPDQTSFREPLINC